MRFDLVIWSFGLLGSVVRFLVWGGEIREVRLTCHRKVGCGMREYRTDLRNMP